MATKNLFDDIFEVTAINPDGKKFERVSRLVCQGITYDEQMIIDINTQVFPCKVGETLRIVFVSTLDEGGTPDTDEFTFPKGHTRLDQYEYAMHGKIFKYDSSDGKAVSIYASFGGLMMNLKGNQEHFIGLKPDSTIYCLVRHNNYTPKK